MAKNFDYQFLTSLINQMRPLDKRHSKLHTGMLYCFSALWYNRLDTFFFLDDACGRTKKYPFGIFSTGDPVGFSASFRVPVPGLDKRQFALAKYARRSRT